MFRVRLLLYFCFHKIGNTSFHELAHGPHCEDVARNIESQLQAITLFNLNWNDTLYVDDTGIQYEVRVGPTDYIGLQQMKINVSQCSMTGTGLWMSISLSLAKPSFRFQVVYSRSNHPELFKSFIAETFTGNIVGSTNFVSYIIFNSYSKKIHAQGVVVTQKSPIYPESLCDEDPNFCTLLHKAISDRMYKKIYTNVTQKLKITISDFNIDL